MKGLPTLMLAAILIGMSALPAAAQPIKARAYAPEHLGALSVADQRRVIGLEYTEQSGGGTIPEAQLRFYLDQVRLSNWGFQQIRNDIAQSLGGNGGYAPANGTETIRCESTDNRPRTCATPWQSESQLVRQLSRTACIAGQNWTTSRGQVWVGSGCRADFGPIAGVSTGQLGGEISCESQDRRERTCPTSWPGPSTLLRQLSQTACIAGQNWSSSPGVVRVSGGCRAVFVPTAESLPREIRCESIQNRYQQCGANLYGNVQLLRQLSDRRCTEGTNWGLRNGAIWVNGGCRAVFRVGGGYGNGYGGGQNNGYGYGDDYVVTCSSEGGRYADCAWDHSRGVPRLLQQLSDRACTQGYSWGYNRRASLWVNHGCRARFAPR